MTQVKATCLACGEVEVAHQAMRLWVCDVPWRSFYEFACPDCRVMVRKDADEHAVLLLRSAKVPEQEWHLPLEAIEQHDGPAITVDDVLDFTIDLARLDIATELGASS